SKAGLLAEFLSGWAAPRGPRRTALERTVAESWHAITLRGGDPSSAMGAVLLPATLPSPSPAGHVSLVDHNVEAAAILSGLWSWKPLSIITTTVGDSTISLEVLLEGGVEAIRS